MCMGGGAIGNRLVGLVLYSLSEASLCIYLRSLVHVVNMLS